MKVTWRTFPKLFIVLPVLHYALSAYTSAESEEHKRKKNWVCVRYSKLTKIDIHLRINCRTSQGNSLNRTIRPEPEVAF